MALRISSLTFAHPHTSAGDRARLALADNALAAAYRRVDEVGIDAFVLSTCLRVEIVSVGCEAALDRVTEILYPDGTLPASGVRRNDQDVLLHLYRVAAGLDSPVVGEPEVLAQFRHAIDTARTAGVIGGSLGKLLESAIGAGRSARRILPDTAEGSLALVATKLVTGTREVAVFGAGAMARAATEALRGRDTEAPIVTVYARRPNEVRFESDHVCHIERAPEALATMPVVISATAAKRELFSQDVLARALEQRTGDLLLIDLAMPPDFTPAANMQKLTYVNLDALAERARTEQVSVDLEALVADTARQNWARLENRHVAGPVIAAILAEAEAAVAEEVERFAPRIQAVDGQSGALVKQLAETVAHRVLHRPLSYLGAGTRGAEAAELLAEIFGAKDA
ncbi:glutamyl-tRNA reductase [bacterium BMS3Abin02]|nr:glutamyl-tRNA reductase [bacterium BMS3Abin02]HDL49840.1 hypothetical protein [Actinomycetota bacterium]